MSDEIEIAPCSICGAVGSHFDECPHYGNAVVKIGLSKCRHLNSMGHEGGSWCMECGKQLSGSMFAEVRLPANPTPDLLSLAEQVVEAARTLTNVTYGVHVDSEGLIKGCAVCTGIKETTAALAAWDAARKGIEGHEFGR